MGLIVKDYCFELRYDLFYFLVFLEEVHIFKSISNDMGFIVKRYCSESCRWLERNRDNSIRLSKNAGSLHHDGPISCRETSGVFFHSGLSLGY